MKKAMIALLMGLTFAISASGQSTSPTTSVSVPILPKVWTGVASDTSIGAVSQRNPLHYLLVGKDREPKGWNTYDGPASITVLRQEGRHLELQFKNPKFQIKEVGTLSSDGTQIQLASKNASGLLTIDGNRITGCGNSRGTNGLADHWFSSYSSWCDDYYIGTALANPPAQVVAILPKVWTGFISGASNAATNKPDSQHNTNSEKPWDTFDAPRTLNILRQEGRHIELLWKSATASGKWIGMISQNGKELQIDSKYGSVLLNISGEQMSGCGLDRGNKSAFHDWKNQYKTYCFNFLAGTTPPALNQNVLILPKEWKGHFTVTSEGAANQFNPLYQSNSIKDRGWNAYDSSALITIQRQKGQHLEILFKTDVYQMLFIATLSFDGKQLMMVNNNAAHLFSVAGNKISGCGVARGNGTFKNWLNNYHASCNEWVAVN
jgi:hypothetical protein